MASAYDRKFEEMKNYIPFLENMIKNLDRTGSSSVNPRQAQLDKIRALRDLLLDTNKRMKMENLLKCEQVLINLYAKVEKKTPFSNIKPSGVKNTTTSKEKCDLEMVRNKLKTVSKIQEGAETLPEIARANDIEQDYTGSKEPALFQRRPHRSSISPVRPAQNPHNETKIESPQAQSKRNYTRVLLSPDQSPQRWSSSQQIAEKPLFSRRSPAQPKIKSPQSNKKDKKMSSKKVRKTNDLNITLNVPEKSLNSLNTKDILSRILNCSDGDVDIDTLRELRSQILGELKQTGKNDDISDLILKSYHKKAKPISKTRRKDDVEEGEISDSESEAIESIYGSLVVVDKDKKSLAQAKTIEEKDSQQRKIQICLVINADNDESPAINKRSGQPQAIIDLSEFEMFSESEGSQSKDVISIDSDTPVTSPMKNITSKKVFETGHIKKTLDMSSPQKNKCLEIFNEVVTIEDDDTVRKEQMLVSQDIEVSNEQNINQTSTVNCNAEKCEVLEPDVTDEVVYSPSIKDAQTLNKNDSNQKESIEQVQENPEPPKYKANFYKPIEEQQNLETVLREPNSIVNNDSVDKNSTTIINVDKQIEEQQNSESLLPEPKSISNDIVEKENIIENSENDPCGKIATPTKMSTGKEDDTQIIPLLNEPTVPPKAKTDVLSEIDILQALKNEILSDTIAMPGSESVTPALHLPKLTKVASAQEVLPKKRISIENYKQKTSTCKSKPLFVKNRNRLEESKKQSLKLTEKECERFNFPKRMSFDSDEVDDNSDDDFLNDDKDNSLGLDDIYGDLAPKSPENEASNESITPPVVIPMDPVKATVVSSKTDVDMRALLPTPQLQPVPLPVPAPIPPPLISSLGFGTVVPPSPAYNRSEASKEQTIKDRISAMDPRMRRDLNSSINSPNPYTAINPERTPRSTLFPNMVSTPNMTPSRTPSMTPSYMPSIPLLMTPNARSFETHQSFELDESSTRKHVYAPSFSICDNREREASVSKDGSLWEGNKNDPRSGRRRRWEDSNISAGGSKWEDPRSNFAQTDVSNTPRYDDVYKPKYDKFSNRNIKYDKYNSDKRDSYSKSDCPTTPIPSFGWSECPPTPSSAFGRQEAPMTPTHPFGRLDCPSTPSHPFGRSDCPSTPTHSFGRADCPPTPGSVFGRQDPQLTSSNSFHRAECPATPSHPFGRSECPPTPSHSFGRSDCPQTPNHPFGRSESYGRSDVNNSNNHKYNKDPRLNRKPTEYESSSYSEKDRDYQSERNHSRKSSSYKSQSRNYSGPDASRNYERESVDDFRRRNDRNYSSDRGGRQYDRDRRESSLGRILSRDSENDRLYTRNRESRIDSRNSKIYDDEPRREQRERSIGPASRKMNFVKERSISRASSVGRTLSSEHDKDKISLKSDTGRDLTINTSVKTTFQDFLASGKPIQVFDYTFDARRQRAASVGRSLVCENSLRRIDSTAQKSNESYRISNNDRFKRASSMGRELRVTKTEKSFQEIKADFESYRSNTNLKKENKERKKYDTNKETSKDKVGLLSSRYKKDDIIYQERVIDASKQPYSPRKNKRDPRVRKEQPEEYRSRYKIDRRVDQRDRRKSGIVYSNDNIARGTIMGSGFGVKNYKIPKIKRIAVEPEEVKAEDKTESSETNVTKDKKVEPSESDTKPLPNVTTETKKTRVEDSLKTKNCKQNENHQDDNISDSEIRVTRSKKKADTNRAKEDDLVLKSRKYKKAVISDSESDSGVDKELVARNVSKSKLKLHSPTKKMNKSKESISPLKDKEIHNKSGEGILESNFGIDDMEIFSENIESDPVIENINALIADLDQDLDSSKISNANFVTDIEQMMETINSPESNSLGDISEVIEKDLNESNEFQQKLKEKQNNSSPNIRENVSDIKEMDKDLTIERPTASEFLESLSGYNENCNDSLSKVHEAIVSTTEIDQVSLMNKKADSNDAKTSGQYIPDSTINKNAKDKTEDGIPDSTNDLHCELSSDVTSSNDTTEKTKNDTEIQKSSQNETFSSIGNLLSILQDKSKIKELLSMLGGGQSSENEKIKKKLEKLSEIVSEDEDEKEVQEKDVMKGALVTECPTEITRIEQINIDNQVDLKVREKVDVTHTEYINDKTKQSKEHIYAQNISTQNINEDSNTKDTKEDITAQNSDNHGKKLDDEVIKESIEKTATNIPKITESENFTTLNKDKASENSENEHASTVNEEDDKNNRFEQNEEQGDDMDDEPLIKTKKKVNRKIKGKRGSGRLKPAQKKTKCMTQLASVQIKKPITKNKPSRELQKLQEDIKEMFMSDDILNATGIRMCRLAKMVTDNDYKKIDPLPDSEPVVVLEKVKGIHNQQGSTKKKLGLKLKSQLSSDKKTKSSLADTKMDKPKGLPKHKPGPKCKSKQKSEDTDPYDFDADSVTDTNTTKESDGDSSDSENESLASSRSFGSSEVLAESKKKPKRKRRGTRGWQSGIIKPKNKKKKEQKNYNALDDSPIVKPQKPITIPDLDCFTDKTYCFQKGVSTYDCRLCVFSGTDIVNHYKKQHPHTEIPLSRMDPNTAEVAIQQCEEINIQAICKIPSDRYTCRFCRKEFGGSRTALETFFWHIVSSHTGEFKHLCSECVNVTRCPFNLDIPPPPKDGGQLIGYLCGKCNFTQISLENLKTHVIVRHNDEQTEVYTINLALMSKKAINTLLRRSEAEQPRVLRSLRSNQSASDAKDYRDDRSDTTESSARNSESDSAAPVTEDQLEGGEQKPKPEKIKTKLTFENDEPGDEPAVKIEAEEQEADDREDTSQLDDTFSADTEINNEIEIPRGSSDDIVDYPHFKLNSTESGAKEYVCCINGNDNHYKTPLLISMKKHIQSKHSEKWDGYCCLCKVIVTLQGVQSCFKDCLAHFLDKHMDNFPVYEKRVETVSEENPPVSDLPTITPELPRAVPLISPVIPARVATPPVERTASPSYIAVRPLAELISKDLAKEIQTIAEEDTPIPFPKIENVVSLGDEPVLPAAPSPVYPTTAEPASQPDKPFLYEDVQAQVMSKKHRVVLDAMMSKENLVRVFKCAGRFCSFTSDSPEDALLHATTHQRIGGEGSLNCAYCNYDAGDNGIDLVMHVFKEHSRCQYCCPMCFYRSAASQLVGVHFTKAHGAAWKQKNVLRSTAAVAPPGPEKSDLLTREVAVRHYICHHDAGSCNFRTYTPGKFIEHLQMKHVAATSHPCNICNGSFPSGPELVVHQRSHGLKLYQCTWCVWGGNTEAELLAHAAALHPHRQPQAYVRVITNKDGSSQRRVLPLAYLNKSKLTAEDVTPSTTKENPVREAERSIELEKLIGHTMMMFEASTSHNASHSLAPEVITEEISSSEELAEALPENETAALESLLLSSTSVTTTENTTVSVTSQESQLATTTTMVTAIMTETTLESAVENVPSEKDIPSVEPAEKTTLTSQETLVVKSEPADAQKGLVDTAIICLDSDDEESSPVSEKTPVNASASINTNSLPEEPTNAVNKEASRSSITDEVSITKITDDNKPTSGKSIDDDTRQNIIDLSDDEPSVTTLLTAPTKIATQFLFKCPKCFVVCKTNRSFRKHVGGCTIILHTLCPHKPCTATITGINKLVDHFLKVHKEEKMHTNIIHCGICPSNFNSYTGAKLHIRLGHKIPNYSVTSSQDEQGNQKLTINPAEDPQPRISGRKTSTEIQRYGIDPEPPSSRPRKTSTENKKRYGIHDIDKLPINPILDTQVYCDMCEFGTKVRLNMVRHLQQHVGSMPVPHTQPVNPVPHLESNEKHFDKMVNLASSSVLTRAPDKPARPDTEPAVTLMIPPAESSRYPKYVPERQRYTCGAKACTYISVDMAMFKRHWETLHAGADEYRCVHCPPNQALDTSIPLTATRILAHLRMHDVSLYACNICSYYHYRKHLVEKHLSEIHKDGNVKIVREESLQTSTPPTPPPAVGAPTMDLKAWQCGLCEFNSMLRPEVVNHCSVRHQSKMQFKCAYCPFRTSNKENVIKHQTNAHPSKVEEIFYYFYREGSVPDDKDGVPRWQKQRQKLGLEEDAEVKTEPEPSEPVSNESATITPIAIAPIATPALIDLNLVKKEVEEANPGVEMTIENLCKKFGQFCDPDGIKYKCSLCNSVREHTREAMQCHLYEELNYRRWECAMCTYKAFHRAGLNDHMSSEHSRQYVDPRALPVDANIEKWVSKLLDYQASIIETNRVNLAVQKIQVERITSAPASPRKVESPKPTSTSDPELEQAFGTFGDPQGQQFACPKCDFMSKDETDTRYHLESELTKIRWGCTNCANKFQTFHEAQFHCKSAHTGQPSRPKEAIRDPSLRSGWISAVITAQKRTMKADTSIPYTDLDHDSEDDSDSNENSLLVARYDEPVTTEELSAPTKRAAPSAESDDERLIIDEPQKKKFNTRDCPYCDYTCRNTRYVREHILRHYDIKPYKCANCPFEGNRNILVNHVDRYHPGGKFITVQIPNHLPPNITLKPTKRDTKEPDDVSKTVCLYCEKSVSETDMALHTHGNEKPEFAKRGSLVVKCCKCLVLRLTVTSLQEHFDACHPSEKFNYAYYKLQVDTREIHCCGHCYKKFKFLRDLKAHHMAIHTSLSLSYTSIPFNHNLHTEDIDAGKRKMDDDIMPGPSSKRVARKSTTKLPSSMVAKKSTTKLPMTAPEEYSCYGSKPLPIDNYTDVTVNMPMYNTMVEIDVKKLSGILKIDPKVVVRDCQS